MRSVLSYIPAAACGLMLVVCARMVFGRRASRPQAGEAPERADRGREGAGSRDSGPNRSEEGSDV